MKGSGVLVGNFELNLLGRPTWAWAILLLIPERDKEPLTNREIVTEDVLLKVFTAAYMDREKELPNHKIKLHVSPRAYIYSRLVAT